MGVAGKHEIPQIAHFEDVALPTAVAEFYILPPYSLQSTLISNVTKSESTFLTFDMTSEANTRTCTDGSSRLAGGHADPGGGMAGHLFAAVSWRITALDFTCVGAGVYM